MVKATDEEFMIEAFKCHLACRNCHMDETRAEWDTGQITRKFYSK